LATDRTHVDRWHWLLWIVTTGLSSDQKGIEEQVYLLNRHIAGSSVVVRVDLLEGRVEYPKKKDIRH
jgi:hypothetical protein